MQIKTLTVGKTTVRNNVFLAPIAGYTDYAFRHLAIEQGYGLTFTELVSAKGLAYDGNGSKELLYAGEDYEYTSAQIFGADEYYMRSACENPIMQNYRIIDINMGCPVPKVYKNGEGSALLTDIKKAEKIITECVKSGKTITVKIRIGIKKGDDIASEYAKMVENAGASLITIHGRVRDDYYSGEPDYNAIAKAKASVNIPVIANGGIFTLADADKMLDETGADGVMLARGGIANPFLVCELLGLTPKITLKEYMINQLLMMQSRYGEVKAYREFRKFLPYYFKGEPNSKQIRTTLNQIESVSRLVEIIGQTL